MVQYLGRDHDVVEAPVTTNLTKRARCVCSNASTKAFYLEHAVLHVRDCFRFWHRYCSFSPPSAL